MEDATARKAQPDWSPPSAEGKFITGLHFENSLARAQGLVPFVPIEGRRVAWYICGPTTYDSSHLGHARNYVSFDVIRRVLEDYFGYEVFSVMNITDVDDKIILKARRSHLYQQYAEANPTVTASVQQDLLAAWDKRMQSLKGKIADLEALVQQHESLATADDTGEAPEMSLDEAVKTMQLWRGKLAAAQDEHQRVTDAPLKAGAADFLAAAADELGTYLDDQHGDSITDHSIFRALAARYEEEYWDDMKALNVRMPHVITRVTEYVPEVIEYVQGIIDNGFAYESNGSVYFNTPKFAESEQHDYPRLEPTKFGNARLLAEGEGSLAAGTSEKQDERDFALWKASKPGEPSWDSPWGAGRPGWHIECSAMAGTLLGQNLDIHGGGADLTFPHHDNEMAQAEAFFHGKGCSQWVNYFLHSGHLDIEGLKMSKSLKNFTTIREELAAHSARRIRIFFLMRQWNSRVDYSKDAMMEAAGTEDRFVQYFARIASAVRSAGVLKDAPQRWTDADLQYHKHILDTQDEVDAALKANVNTGRAMKALLAFVSTTHSFLNDNKEHRKAFLLQKGATFVTRILSVFGLLPERAIGIPIDGASGATDEVVDALMDAVSAFRSAIRTAGKAGASAGKMLQLCDELRNQKLPLLGFMLEDDSDIPWRRVDPEEAAKRVEADRQKRRLALERKIRSREQDLITLQTDLLTPGEALARDGGLDQYGSQRDDDGVPTHLADGEVLGKGARKKVLARFKKQRARHAKAQALVETNPNAVEELTQAIQALKVSLSEV